MATNIEATYRVVTPMFCGGADPDDASARPEIRAQSFKGILRFWWRALAWSSYGAKLGAIQEKEVWLFGDAVTSGSRVKIDLKAISNPEVALKDSVLRVGLNGPVVGEGARYLGYGVMEAFARRANDTQAGQLTRPCILPGSTFVVRLRCKAEIDADLDLVKKALSAAGTVGGMGAKSRKGYGSLNLVSLRVNGEEQWNAPTSMTELGDKIRTLTTRAGDSPLPKYTAFDSNTRHVLVSGANADPLDLLDKIGRELIRYRSWGRAAQIFGSRQPSEKNFQDDHDLMKDVGRGNAPKGHPRRIAFGLPHNYGRRREDQVGPADNRNDRRASPIFVHIHECGDIPVAVVSLFPTQFLPSTGSQISVGGHSVDQKPEQELYEPIHEFLNRLVNRGRTSRREPFASQLEV